MWKYSGVTLIILFIQCVDLKLFVDTEVGTIQGLQADDGDYVMFLGVPYAQVNTSNPFGASIPRPKFNGVFKAFNDSIICPQIEEFSKLNTGILDCLRLNVYVPNTNNQNKSILFYLHGGNFRQGHSSKYLYGPQYLVRHDVIVVIINYRLGPYGFLCTDTPEIPGNQGLKDQYTALKWVKNNIHAFGGNPHSITIVGHSAGSMSVDIHLLAKQPRLFEQAILQSGAATISHAFIPSDEMAMVKIAHRLGFETTDNSAAISFLANADPKMVINASISDAFGPCVEKEFKGVFRYVAEHPEIAKPHVDGLNILGGFTNREWLFGLYGGAFIDKFSNPHLFREELDWVFDFLNSEEIATIVQHFYLGDGQNDESNKYKVVNFLSDFNFVYSVQRALIKYSKQKNTTIFQYLFSYDGKKNFFKNMYNVTESGASHADELGYIFYSELNKVVPNAEDSKMIDRMTALWTNFVKYGNPTPTTTDLIPIIWPPMNGNDLKCLQIDKNMDIISRPFHDRLAFWDLLFKAYSNRIKTSLSPAQKSSANIIIFGNINVVLYIIVNFLVIIF